LHPGVLMDCTMYASFIIISSFVSIHKWLFSQCAAFSAGFRLRRTNVYALTKTFVRPCALKKFHIYKLETL